MERSSMLHLQYRTNNPLTWKIWLCDLWKVHLYAMVSAVRVDIDYSCGSAITDFCEVAGIELSTAPKKAAASKTVISRMTWVPYGDRISDDNSRTEYVFQLCSLLHQTLLPELKNMGERPDHLTQVFECHFKHISIFKSDSCSDSSLSAHPPGSYGYTARRLPLRTIYSTLCFSSRGTTYPIGTWRPSNNADKIYLIQWGTNAISMARPRAQLPVKYVLHKTKACRMTLAFNISSGIVRLWAIYGLPRSILWNFWLFRSWELCSSCQLQRERSGQLLVKKATSFSIFLSKYSAHNLRPSFRYLLCTWMAIGLAL